MANVLSPAICLMGPTASGKTDLAIYLCEQLPLEIISVDSAMVYRGMDIGTAKPDADTLRRAPHRLIDLVDPAEAYSAARFREDALREMATITAQGHIPLLVGGTMLYFRALLQGLSELPSADESVRQRLEAEGQRLGWEQLHARLAKVDPEAAQRIHPNDPQRIQRALEVYEMTGVSLSELQKQQSMEPFPYRVLKIAVIPADRAVLHSRIAQRFQVMLEQGFVAEVEGLFKRGDLDQSLPSIRAVGYRQIWDFLQGRIDYTDMVEKGVIATRQLAKRQLTWLRSEPDLVIFDSLRPQFEQDVLKTIESFLSN